MRFSFLASCNRKEIMRDPLTEVLGIALPLVMIIFFTILQKNAPLEIFKIKNLTPGIIVFGFSFLTMFSGGLLIHDKGSSFLVRLFASPMTATDYIVAYSLPMLPIALLQCICCLVTAAILGIPISIKLIILILLLIPQAVLAIFMGLLFGTILSETQLQGIGTMYITIGAILSGAWMDLNKIGGPIKEAAYLLPFAHSTDLGRAVLSGNTDNILYHLVWVCAYAVLAFIIAVVLFKKRMNADHN
jgi:ABC-2 type transport system permease protein